MGTKKRGFNVSTGGFCQQRISTIYVFSLEGNIRNEAIIMDVVQMPQMKYIRPIIVCIAYNITF